MLFCIFEDMFVLDLCLTDFYCKVLCGNLKEKCWRSICPYFAWKIKTDRVLVSTGHRSVLYFGFWRVLWFILTAHKLLWAIFFCELSDFFQSQRQTLLFAQSSLQTGNVDNSTQKYNWDFIDFWFNSAFLNHVKVARGTSLLQRVWSQCCTGSDLVFPPSCLCPLFLSLLAVWLLQGNDSRSRDLWRDPGGTRPDLNPGLF